MRKSAFHYAVPFLVLAAAAALPPGCRSVQVLPGQRVEVAVAADGRAEDFTRRITSHLYENGALVGVGNDDRCLYVFFSPDVRHARRPPGRATLACWLDAQGGRERTLGLVHESGPLAMTGHEPAAKSADANDFSNQTPKTAPTPTEIDGEAGPGGSPPERQAGFLKVIDRRNGREAFIAVDGSQGPEVRLASDWGDFAYRLSIPLPAAGDWPGVGARPGAVMTIGLEWKFEPADEPRSERAAHGGEGRGRMKAPPSGRERDGFASPPGMPGTKPATRRALWIRATLVPQPAPEKKSPGARAPGQG